ncbi:MAG: helix-turn-helix domain-containing protein [Fimbriimonadaceae bacterium]|nr:helix-turn-helix domain-containing protein [Fimbriimonadaceae bacterium]
MSKMAGTKQFDPVTYIENAFLDTPDGKPNRRTRRTKASADNGEVKFRKTSLRAPRPRRAAATTESHDSVLDDDLRTFLAELPNQIEFLGAYFTDDVTRHYYTSEFKESRTDLIRRLLDPELTLEEVSRLLGVCPATVRRYTNREWLNHHRTKGGQRRFRLSDVIGFVKNHGRHPEF